MKQNERHGLSYSKEYRIWASMKDRCHNPNNKGYRLYGSRGIRVCDRWRESFSNFYADMGDKPDGMSLDRIDPTLGYSPENCRWATDDIQMHNRNPYNKLGVRNIRLTKFETYQVIMSHQGKVIYRTFKTLEEAIKGRNNIEEFLYV